MHRQRLFRKHVRRLPREGAIRYDTTVVDGIEQTSDARLDLLRGGPQPGKHVADVRDG